MRVLVTGGAGYVGSHACKALAAAGHEPIVYDDLSAGHRWAAKWGPFERGDIGDHATLSRAMAKHRPEAVMHFAAHAYVGESVVEPEKYYRNNVAGTLVLLQAVREQGLSRFIFSSTCATYGAPSRIPIPEDHEQIPINPYGRSKLMVEQILRDFGEAYGLRSVALRYFNAAGADPDGEVGEEHDPEPHLVPRVLKAAAGTAEGITIFGDDYDTEDGTCVRDYAHVSDLAAAHVLALEQIDVRRGFSAFNLGTGSGLSVRSVIEIAQKVTGRSVRVAVGPRRPGDPPILIADAIRARDELGWRPLHSSADEILQTAWAWMTRKASAPPPLSIPRPTQWGEAR